MKLTEFLGKIGKFSLVLGFLPILAFFLINLKVPTFFNDGYPTGTKLTIGLQETELITADMVDKGY